MNYGRYETVRELGKGSMGVVYQARDPQIERLVALKVLRPELVTTEGFIQRFLKEARAIGRLSHPNIVTVYDVGSGHGTIYIAMEFVAGDRLDKLMEERKFTEREIVNLGGQVAGALDYAHRNGVIHRDIKPSNIILQPNGQLKITDFGIARIEDPSVTQQTRAGEILGTPAYMSPEQVLGQPVDGRSDLYSLGGVLYELASGQRPFTGKNLTAVFRAITQERPPDPIKLKSSISPSLSTIIMKCLNKRPEQRFPTGEAMAEALERCLGERESISTRAPKTAGLPKKRRFILYGLLGVAAITGGFFYRQITRRPLDVSSPTKMESVPADDSSSKAGEDRLGFLNVKSEPVGAQVFVDGGFKGKTPLYLELPLGKHEIRLNLPDHYDWEAQVDLEEEGETPLLVRLIPVE